MLAFTYDVDIEHPFDVEGIEPYVPPPPIPDADLLSQNEGLKQRNDQLVQACERMRDEISQLLDKQRDLEIDRDVLKAELRLAKRAEKSPRTCFSSAATESTENGTAAADADAAQVRS